MTRFSVGIEDDGDGPSNREAPLLKRARVVQSAGMVIDEELSEREDEEEESGGEEEEEDEEEEEEDEEEEDEELEEETAAQQATINSSQTTTTDSSISITLTDPEVLDCPICYEALTIPVFQCDNGHVACSTCCFKIRNKCPSCASSIGYSRCRAIERVLESVKMSCQYTKYGCREAFSYNMKQRHEKACLCVPCSCPIVGCNFSGSLKQLYGHFGSEHKKSATSFRYDRQSAITLEVDQKFLILREETDGSLFILSNKVETLGNVVSLSRIGPLMEKGFGYELTTKAQAEQSTLRFQSLTRSTPRRVESHPPSTFLLVPREFFSIYRQVKMYLHITRPIPRSPHFPVNC